MSRSVGKARCREIISEWLTGIGLELKPEKTRLTHTLNHELSEDGKAGFDFLGHHIQQYPAGKYRSNINSQGTILGFNTLITPSAKASKAHIEEIGNLQLLHRHCHDEKTALDLIEIRKKDRSKFREKLSQFWNKSNWEWIHDIPNFIGHAVRKSDMTNG